MTDSGQIQTVGQRFLTTFADRDFARVQACFDREAKFRALIPPGVCEAADAAGATSHLHEWFGGADHFEILRSELGTVCRPTAHRLSTAGPRRRRLADLRAAGPLRRSGRQDHGDGPALFWPSGGPSCAGKRPFVNSGLQAPRPYC